MEQWLDVSSFMILVWTSWSHVEELDWQGATMSALASWVLDGGHKICERFYFCEEYVWNVSSPDVISPPGPRDAEIIVQVEEAEGPDVFLLAVKKAPKTAATNKVSVRFRGNPTNMTG